MIQPEKLRIGNFLIPVIPPRGSSGDPSEIYVVSKYSFAGDGIAGCIPIPLTEKWLIRFGFNERKNDQYSYYHISVNEYTISFTFQHPKNICVALEGNGYYEYGGEYGFIYYS